MTQKLPPSLDGPVVQALLDLLPGTLHVKDRQYRYCMVNRKYLERWGARPHEVIGRTSTEAFGGIFGPGPDKRNEEVFATGRALPFYEVTYPDKQGGSVILWSTKVPILDEQGVVTHVLTFSLDITPLKRMQEELERQRQTLHQSERLSVLGNLAAGISHELRNPLTAVLAQAKLLEEELDAGKSQKRLGAIVRAAERCAAIVHAFLDQSRAGPRKVEHVDVEQIVASALDLTAFVLRERNISLSVEHSHAGATVEGDPHQLSQVVLNLLLNASEAMRESDAPRELAIRTRLNETTDSVELTVSDTGPGIVPELRERIFERFFTTKAVGAGTGLGLAICRDIVAAHGGRISAESAARGGAVFRVTLPASQRTERAEAGATGNVGAVPSCRVLVVDDDSQVVDLLREILELAGHDVDVAASGESALERLGGAEYDVVLSDMRMPGMDGAALYDALCGQHPRLAARFGYITGDTLSADSAAFLRRSGIPHLSKPFEPRQVAELVAQLGSGDATHKRRA
jgi:PAS domain S-box-containing protein